MASRQRDPGGSSARCRHLRCSSFRSFPYSPFRRVVHLPKKVWLAIIFSIYLLTRQFFTAIDIRAAGSISGIRSVFCARDVCDAWVAVFSVGVAAVCRFPDALSIARYGRLEKAHSRVRGRQRGRLIVLLRKHRPKNGNKPSVQKTLNYLGCVGKTAVVGEQVRQKSGAPQLLGGWPRSR